MDEAHVVELSGHDSPHSSAVHEYIRSSRVLCFPAATIAAGHEPLPRGACGKPPVPPTLDALTQAPTFMEGLIDTLYMVHRYLSLFVCTSLTHGPCTTQTQLFSEPTLYIVVRIF